LLKDGGLRSRLSEEGFNLVRDCYQWKRIEGMIGDIVLNGVPPQNTQQLVQVESGRRQPSEAS
jgi:hypothetical protein